MTPTNNPSGDLERVSVPRWAVRRLILAADSYGVRYLDSDDMTDEATELQEATEAMKDLIAAAPAPSGEAVAWQIRTSDALGGFILPSPEVRNELRREWLSRGWEVRPLFAAPPPAREEVARAIYAALGHEGPDPWDAATARRDRLGMVVPYTLNQQAAIEAADAILALLEPRQARQQGGA